MHFIRYELREGETVAVFRLASPVLEFGWDGEEHWTDETAFDRPSLEARLRNLQQNGRPVPATSAALAGWPMQGAASPAGIDVAGRSIPARRKAEAVMRVLRGEAVEAVARSQGVPEAAVLSWRDAFILAGASVLGSQEPVASAGIRIALEDGW